MSFGNNMYLFHLYTRKVLSDEENKETNLAEKRKLIKEEGKQTSDKVTSSLAIIKSQFKVDNRQ
jgi:hypothetical protein